MTSAELCSIKARAEAAVTFVPVSMDAVDLTWHESQLGAELYEDLCPLCDGGGIVHSSRYDHKSLAATVVAYGIGSGFSLAEYWCRNGPRDMLRLIDEIERLKKAKI